MGCRRLFAVALFSILVLLANIACAMGQDGPAVQSVMAGNGDASAPLSSITTSDQSQGTTCCDACCGQSCSSCRWTASAEFITLDRTGSVDRTLAELVPGTVPLGDLHSTFGPEALNACDFRQGFAGGPKVGLTRHGDCACDLELSYYEIDGWSSARSVGPYDHDQTYWMVMRAPGGFLQTQDGYQSMAWDYATKLNNLEFNARWNPCCALTLLAGLRWVELRENLQGTLTPPTFSWEPPFWNTDARNNLYGFQVGADGKLLDSGRISIDGLVKAGIYDNQAEEATGVSIFKATRLSYASTNHAAFVGEIGLQCKYQITDRLAATAGYQAIWLDGVALAPAQIDQTVTIPLDIVVARGVNCDGGVFYHGATVGLEYAF